MLAQRQWALLSAAFLLLKQGGFLVYATCALADAENDSVVQKLLKKYGNAVVVHSGTAATEFTAADTEITDGSVPAVHRDTATVEPGAANPETVGKNSTPPILGEKTLFGSRFLPDTCGGAGPLYFSLIEKLDRGDS